MTGSDTTKATLAGIVILLVCLLPILRSNLFSDDLYNFQQHHAATVKDIPVFDKTVQLINTWKEKGRFTPLSFFLMEYSFDYFIQVSAYKAFVFVMNILAVLVFVLYLRILRLNINYGTWLLCFAGVMQFRVAGHDAYTTFNGMYQFLAICIFATLIFYTRHLLHRKCLHLVLALLCFTACILSSEIGLVALLLLPLNALLLKVSFRKLFLSALPFAVLFVVYLLYIAVLRKQVTTANAYDGLQADFNLFAMGKLMLKQVYSSLPLSHLTNTSAIPVRLFHQLMNTGNLLSVIVIIAAGYFMLKTFHDATGVAITTDKFPAILFALALMSFPAIFLLPSVKYQQGVTWGMGYLPVYLQNFGSATLFALLTGYCRQQADGRGARYASALGIFMLCSTVVGFLFNNVMINTRAYTISFPAQALYMGVKKGLLNECPEGSAIVLGTDYYWKDPQGYANLFKKITGKQFHVFDAGTRLDTMNHAGCYFVACEPASTVSVKIYAMNCLNPEEKMLLKQMDTVCPVDVIKEDIGK